MGLHFGLCHGPVDSLSEIIIGDRRAWEGNETSSGLFAVFAPYLFGGDEREGGIGGNLSLMMGESTQTQNSYLVSRLGASVPAFRGILSAVFEQGYIAANNPYVKPWAFRVTRTLAGWSGGTAWYPEKAQINCGEG